MSDLEMSKIYETSSRRVSNISLSKKRFLASRIDWRDRLIAISGARGTGKTTLILQHIKESFADRPEEALYVSLDSLWFEKNELSMLVDSFYKNGGTHIFIDEVHYLKGWQTVIKNIYDDYPGLHIVYTGSSLLKLDADAGDLSRRQIRYELPGLSFREYLYFEDLYEGCAYTLEEILNNHVRLATEITGDMRILKYFSDYLVSGYYPFYKEVYAGYDLRLQQIVNQILESDYPATNSINYSTIQKIKKMLYILVQSCPQTPNMSELFRELETDRNQGLKMLYILESARLLNLLSAKKATLANMGRPDKIYCDNTNIMYSFSENINIGTKRETFFLNQLRSAGYEVAYPQTGDFVVDGRLLFEVGGRRKTFEQIKDIPDSYLAIDDEEIGRGNRIPLWMFGFLY